MSITTAALPSSNPLPPSPPHSPSDRNSPKAQLKNHFNGPDTPARSPLNSTTLSTSTSLKSISEGPATSRGRSESAVSKASVVDERRQGGRTTELHLNDFQLIRVLGKGCAGRVLLVKHTSTNATHAMKAISKRSAFTHDELWHTLTEQAILKRFAVEEPDNAFVAKLHYSFTDRENFYFVMDFYPGGDLATQMEIYGILGHHRTRFYAADIVQGLDDLHRHGIIVRDLKPENVLLNAKGHAVLADFGLSKEFGYRGEPKALNIITYPGQPEVPEWAGAGAASSRMFADGNWELVVDRAYSFVGTAEYLAPEVVKRGEYSYAVDWWALGCIVIEGLTGRVPFRKEDDEAPLVLWDKVLLHPWHDIFNEPKLARRPPIDYGLDPTTWSFVDSLLIKDPMWRLTEPFVQQHAYFAFIDWETIRRGEYEDPHGLQLHPTVEYNTQYFPKLCLEEEPTVDMITHEKELDDNRIATSLNDDQLYALEQARFRAELDAFTWTRDDTEADLGGRQSDVDNLQGESDQQLGRTTDDIHLHRPLASYSLLEGVPESPYCEQNVLAQSLAGNDESPGQLVQVPTRKAENVEALVPQDDMVTDPPLDAGLMEADSHREARITSSSISHSLPPTTSPPVAPPLYLAPGAMGIARKESSPSAPIRIPVCTITDSERGRPLDLCSDLPVSGLSASDVVSVASHTFGGPHRLVHRHPLLPATETHSVHRLSVDLNGTIRSLDDEEWEELNAEGAESLPNGHPRGTAPSTFLTRGFTGMLRRRPSTLITSGLRRQTKSSESSRDSSPTKSRPAPSPGLFASRSVESTRRAFERLKTFPRMRKGGEGKVTPFVLRPTEEVVDGSLRIPSPSRPGNSRRHTESRPGWNDEGPKLRKQASASGSRTPKQSGSSSESNTGAMCAPRVELTSIPPVVWEYGDRQLP